MAKPPSPPKQKPQAPPPVAVPAENVQLLRDALGIDLESPGETFRATLVATTSRSVCPYTSPEMLDGYVKHGMPEVKDRALDTIDEERHWRHAREEQEQNHQHALDMKRLEIEQNKVTHDQNLQNRSQIFSFSLGLVGVIGTLVGGYLHVPVILGLGIVAVAVGGPSTASVIAQLIAKTRK